jgi:hypothetical protein
MDYTTRNETIRALAAATAADIRMRPARALRAQGNTLPPISGEIDGVTWRPCPVMRGEQAQPRTTDRELPLERTPNHYTGEPRSGRDEVAR